MKHSSSPLWKRLSSLTLAVWFSLSQLAPLAALGAEETVEADIGWYLADREADAYTLGTEAQLRGLGALVGGLSAGLDPVSFQGVTFTLDRDVDLSAPWVPIGTEEAPFSGVFDGGGHRVSGLSIAREPVTAVLTGGSGQMEAQAVPTVSPEGTTGVPSTEEPLDEPSDGPSEEPSEVPSEEPSDVPSEEPFDVPSEEPSDVPSEEPSDVPSEEPSDSPSEEPVEAPEEDGEVALLDEPRVPLAGLPDVGEVQPFEEEAVVFPVPQHCLGLFGYATGELRNLTVDGAVRAPGANYVGGLAGYAGAVTNCGSEAEVTGANYVGGLAGDTFGAVSGCFSTGPVSGAVYVGGIVGCALEPLSNCWSSSAVTGIGESERLGGLAGDVIVFNRAAMLDSFYYVEGGTTAEAAFCGLDTENCYYNAEADADDRARTDARFQSGEVAWLLNASQADAPFWGQGERFPMAAGEGCPVICKVQASVPVASQRFSVQLGGGEAFVYLPQGGTVPLALTLAEGVGPDDVSLSPREALTGPEHEEDSPVYTYIVTAAGTDLTVTCLDKVLAQDDVAWYLTDTGRSEYILTQPGQLVGLAKLVNGAVETAPAQYLPPVDFSGRTIRLGEDIDLSSEADQTPIGTDAAPFSGTLDGGGHTVTLARAGGGDQGLFGHLSDATVRDLTVAGSVSGQGTGTGGVAGSANYSTLTGCVSTAAVSGGENTGGLVGRCTYNTALTDCRNEGSVNGGADTGGLAGWCYYIATLTGCRNEGAVTGTGAGVGGLVGRLGCGTTLSRSFLSASSNQGPVTGTGQVGGLVGCIEDARVYQSPFFVVGEEGVATNSGAVTGSGSGVGGVIGEFAYLYSNTYDVLDQASNTGAVTGSGNVGGGVGLMRLGRIRDFTNTGDITCRSGANTGGVVGGTNPAKANSPVVLERCANSGTLDGDANVGGIAGFLQGDVSLKDLENSGEINAAGSCAGGLWGRLVPTAAPTAYTGLLNTGDVWSHASPAYVGGLGGTFEAQYTTLTLESDRPSNTGAVHATDGDYAGGLLGLSYGDLKNGVNSGDVSGRGYVGGVVGGNPFNPYITLSADSPDAPIRNTGHVTGTGGNVGGILGGSAGGVAITYAASAGDVSGGADGVGGVLGGVNGGELTGCSFTGSLSAPAGVQAAGLFGQSPVYANLKHSFTYITGAGGDLPLANAVTAINVTDCYYLADAPIPDAPGKPLSAGGFASWEAPWLLDASRAADDSIWAHEPGGGFPIHRSGEKAVRVTLRLTGASGGDALTPQVSDAWSQAEGALVFYASRNTPILLDLSLAQGHTPSFAPSNGVAVEGGVVTLLPGEDTDYICRFGAVVEPDFGWYEEHVQGEPYEVGSEAQLTALQRLVNGAGGESHDFAGETVVLTGDVVLSAALWTPIGSGEHPFRGSFSGARPEGGSYEITGLFCTNDVGRELGLFGRVEGGEISDLSVSGSIVSTGGGDRVGGIAAVSSGGSFVNCAAQMDISAGPGGGLTGTAFVGGMVGRLEDPGDGSEVRFTGCSADGSILGGTYTGGLVGGSAVPVRFEDCSNGAHVAATGSYAGGILGYAQGGAATVLDSANSGAVDGKIAAGGILGQVKYAAHMAGCVNTGAVSGGRYASSGGTASFAGGILGRADALIQEGGSLSVEDCRNGGAVFASYYAGGILGAYASGYSLVSLLPLSLSGCVNTGGVSVGGYTNYSSPSSAGGIVGLFQASGDGGPSAVSRCRSSGRISANPGYAGGMVGDLGANQVEFCSNSGPVSSSQGSGGLVGSAAASGVRGSLLKSYNIGAVSGTVRGGLVGVGAPNVAHSYFLDTAAGPVKAGLSLSPTVALFASPVTGAAGTGLTAEQFASGEAAYLLDNGGDLYTRTQVWTQRDGLPRLREEGEGSVYRVGPAEGAAGIAVDAPYRTAGGAVRLTVTPLAGQVVKLLQALDAEGRVVYSYGGAGGALTFPMPDSDVTVSAAYLTAEAGTTYTVTFHTNGGSPLADRRVPSGSPVGEAVTTRADYEFTGWYRDAALSQPYDLSELVASDLDLYAGWRRAGQVVVRFDLNYPGAPDSDVPGRRTLDAGDSLGDLPGVQRAPTPTVRYELTGWFSARAGGALWDPADPVDGDLTLYAQWTSIDRLAEGTEAEPFPLTPDLLPYLAQQVNFGKSYDGCWFRLTDDAAPETWTLSIGSGTAFAGSLDGGGHTVDLGISSYPLFSAIASGGRVADLKVKAAPAVGSSYAPLASSNSGQIIGCHATLDLTGRDPVRSFTNLGGMVLTNGVSGEMEDCSVLIQAGDGPYTVASAGGVACTNAGVLRRCALEEGSALNAVSTSSLTLGGIAAQALGGSIEDCQNHGDLRGESTNSYASSIFAGGIVGGSGLSYDPRSLTITGCENTGDVSVFSASGNTSQAGGILANAVLASLTVQNCSNSGEIRAEEAGGGILGKVLGKHSCALALEKCSNSQGVRADSGQGFAGGILGCLDYGASGQISGCDNQGDVTAATAGGIAGYLASSTVDPIQDSRNEGTIASFPDSYCAVLGGIVGQGSAVRCTNSGDILAPASGSDASVTVGGIIGEGLGKTYDAVILDQCASLGNIHVEPHPKGGSAYGHNAGIGGVVGQVSGSNLQCYDSYWYGDSIWAPENLLGSSGGFIGAGAHTENALFGIRPQAEPAPVPEGLSAVTTNAGTGVTGLTHQQFASGQAAWMLSHGPDPRPWGMEPDGSPVLADKSHPAVCKLTLSATGPEGCSITLACAAEGYEAFRATAASGGGQAVFYAPQGPLPISLTLPGDFTETDADGTVWTCSYVLRSLTADPGGDLTGAESVPLAGDVGLTAVFGVEKTAAPPLPTPTPTPTPAPDVDDDDDDDRPAPSPEPSAAPSGGAPDDGGPAESTAPGEGEGGEAPAVPSAAPSAEEGRAEPLPAVQETAPGRDETAAREQDLAPDPEGRDVPVERQTPPEVPAQPPEPAPAPPEEPVGGPEAEAPPAPEELPADGQGPDEEEQQPPTVFEVVRRVIRENPALAAAVAAGAVGIIGVSAWLRFKRFQRGK